METYRDADTVYAKVTKAENSRTVSHDTDIRGWIRPVAQHGPDGFPLLNGNVEGFRAGVQSRVLETHVANGWGVDQRHHLLGIVDEEAVEEIDVLVLDGGEVQIPVDVGLTRPHHLQSPVTLLVEILHNVWYQASEILGHTLLRAKGQS